MRRFWMRWLVTAMILFASIFSNSYFVAAQSPEPEKLPDVAISEVNTDEEILLGVNQPLVVVLAANFSTGYAWYAQELDGAVIQQTGEMEYYSPGDRMGAMGKQVLRFQALKTGKTSLRLEYTRQWEPDSEPVNVIEFKLDVSESAAAGTEGWQNTLLYQFPSIQNMPLPEIEVEEMPVDVAPAQMGAPAAGLTTLPEHYSWCELGKCTPIKNQGSCGSCWAFATVGPLELNIKIQDNLTKDLAEQYLVSCNSNGWDCDGGWNAHDYHQWKYITGELDAGAVYESEFPYQASNVACNPPHNHYEKLTNWNYVAGYSVPTYEQVKTAIYNYGPIAVSVCVGPNFHAYRGGIFSTNETASCNGGINHGVVLVGWDDSDNVFIMRNSWGTWWGESGYMRITPGTSNIGYAANYVYYTGEGNPIPVSPSGLTASSTAQNRLTLTWTDNSTNEQGFKIERSVDGTTGWAQIGLADINATSFVDKNLPCGTAYSYRVRAYNVNGNSGYSAKTRNATKDCTAIPAQPTGLSAASASQTRIQLSWTDNSSNEDGFKIDRSPDGVNNWTEIATTSANATGFADSGLPCGTGYYYRVRAYNGNGSSGPSNKSSNATKICSPAAPTGLLASPASASAITLTWTDNSTNEQGFLIERSLDGSTNWTQVGGTGANATSFTQSGLSCGTAYSYRVRAFNSGGNSGYSNKSRNGTLACVPNAPTNLMAASGSKTQLNLTWTDNSSNEDGFKVERSANGTTGWTVIQTLGANVTSYADTGLTCDTRYYYRVRAFIGTSNSGASNKTSNKTSACTP